jgi:hypothetical protein
LLWVELVLRQPVCVSVQIHEMIINALLGLE